MSPPGDDPRPSGTDSDGPAGDGDATKGAEGRDDEPLGPVPDPVPGPDDETSGYGLNLAFRLRRVLGWHGSGYLRLRSELTTYGAEFETLRERAAEAEIESGALERGEALLGAAASALEAGEFELGWAALHAAKRLEIAGLEALGDDEAIRTRARALLDVAIDAADETDPSDATDSRRVRSVRRLLGDGEGNLKDPVAGHEVRAASALLDEHHQREHLKRQHLQQQFNCLQRIGAVALAAFVSLVLLADYVVIAPVVGWSIGLTDVLVSPFATLGGAEIESIGFVVYVPLAGVLGASLFGMRSLRKRQRSARTPQYLTGCRVAFARAVVGGISALVVFAFVRSGLVSLPTAVTSSSSLLLLAFAAGHTEWLASRAAEAAATVVDDAAPGDGG